MISAHRNITLSSSSLHFHLLSRTTAPVDTDALAVSVSSSPSIMFIPHLKYKSNLCSLREIKLTESAQEKVMKEREEEGQQSSS